MRRRAAFRRGWWLSAGCWPDERLATSFYVACAFAFLENSRLRPPCLRVGFVFYSALLWVDWLALGVESAWVIEIETACSARPSSGWALFLIAFYVLRLLRFAQMPGCAPGGAGTFLGRQEKSPKEGGPADCVPFAALRGNLWCAGVGCAAELATRCAFRSNSRRKLVHEAVALYGATATPRPVLLGAFRRVGANADSFSMILIAAHAYGTCAKHHFHQNQPAHAGRSSPTLLSTPGAHSGQRIRARVCLSAASLRETPLSASTTGCL